MKIEYKNHGLEERQLKAGDVVQCIESPSKKEIGDILLKTKDINHPLVNLKTGSLWGFYNLNKYQFILLDAKVVINESAKSN